MKKFLTLTLLFVLSLGAFALSTHAEVKTQFGLNGFAWSWNAGWIKLSSKTINANGEVTNDHDNDIIYGVTFDEAGSELHAKGYAWSQNVGWISFNEADLTKSGTGYSACKGPLNGAPIRAKLVQSGEDYVLKGTARVISATQAPLGMGSYWGGNWDGCIYFDKDSVPSGGNCKVLPGVTFLKEASGNTYRGIGYAWNAGGVKPFGEPACSAIAGGFGGLSYIDFSGKLNTKFKTILKKDEAELAVNVDIANWDGICKSNTGGSIGKNITINYSVSPVEGTTCQLTFNGVNYPLGDSGNNVPGTGSGTKYISYTPNTADAVVSLTCTNLSVKAPTTQTATDTVSCAECSNFKDDDDPDSNADEDDLSCRVACEENGAYTPGANESYKEGEGVNNCEGGGGGKALPKLKEN